MKRIIVGAAVLVLVFAAWVIWGSMRGEKTVVSDDGALSIAIPEGALLDKKMLRDVRIARVLISEGVSAYDLLPHGLEFDKPVKFTLNLSKADGGESEGAVAPLIVHVSGEKNEKREVVSGTLLEYNPAGNIKTVSGNISHFSRLVISRGQVLLRIQKPSGPFMVGENAVVNVDIEENPPVSASWETEGEPTYYLRGKEVAISDTEVSGEESEDLDPGVLSPDGTIAGRHARVRTSAGSKPQ